MLPEIMSNKKNLEQTSKTDLEGVRAGIIQQIPITLNDPEFVLREIGRAIGAREKNRYISITNTESMYHAVNRPAHKQYIEHADFSLCDGVGVILAGLAWGLRVKRYNGPVLQLDCSGRGVGAGWRHYYYGGKQGVAGAMASRLQEAYPGMVVCGYMEPPFRDLTEAEQQAIRDEINASAPDIVWVGLGLLKQEKWIADNIGKINCTWMVGVGAAFDYHAGAIPWAPPLVRRLGLEWLFRTIIQPKLRIKRYWWSAKWVLAALVEGVAKAKWCRRPEIRMGFPQLNAADRTATKE